MRTLSSIEIGQVQGAGAQNFDFSSAINDRTHTYDLPGRATLTTTLEKNHSTTFELEAYDHKFRANSGEELVKFVAHAGVAGVVGAFAPSFVIGSLVGYGISLGVGRLMEK